MNTRPKHRFGATTTSERPWRKAPCLVQPGGWPARSRLLWSSIGQRTSVLDAVQALRDDLRMPRGVGGDRRARGTTLKKYASPSAPDADASQSKAAATAPQWRPRSAAWGGRR